MHRIITIFTTIVLSLVFFTGCDLTEPDERLYNSAAHPPSVADLAALGIMPSDGLAGDVAFTIDPAIGVPPVWPAQLLVDGEPVNGMWSYGNAVGFDTRLYPDGVHTLTLGVMKAAGGSRETGLLGYLGIPDILFTGEILVRQTVPFGMKANPSADRPAVDLSRNVLYVLQRDSVKAFSTLTNALIRSCAVTGPPVWTIPGLTCIALNADGTRLYVAGDLGHGSGIVALDALTLDTLFSVPVSYALCDIECGASGSVYVSSAPGPWAWPGALGILRVLDSGTLQQTSELNLPFVAPMRMVATRDHKTLFLASDGVCRVSVESAAPILQAQKNTGPVGAIGISPDVRRLYIAHSPPQFGLTYMDHVVVADPATLDSTGRVMIDPMTTAVLDVLPAGLNLFMATTPSPASAQWRVERYNGSGSRTATWGIAMTGNAPALQASGDGRFLYANAGGICIPIP